MWCAANTGAAPPGRSRPIRPAGVSAPPFRTSRSGYIDANAAGSWSANDHAAEADDIVAVESSAVAIRILNVVIAILHHWCCAESRLAMIAARLMAFPKIVFSAALCRQSGPQFPLDALHACATSKQDRPRRVAKECCHRSHRLL